MTSSRPRSQLAIAPVGSMNRHRTSSHSGILVSKEDGTPIPLFPSRKPALTSKDIGWAGLLLEQHHLPPVEFPERTANAHLIAMHFRPAILQWFLGGHPQSKRMSRGSIDIIPQGSPLGGFSRDETEFLMIQLDPPLLERTARELGASVPVELTRSLGIRDPQIQHVILALLAELETGCSFNRLYGDTLAVALSAHLVGKFAAEVPVAVRHTPVLSANKLRRVIEYIDENLAEDLTLAQIASVALLAVPIAVFGAYLSLSLRHFENDVYAQIGLVMLIGLAAKNAILIVEFAKADYDKGKPLVEAALGAARLRFRPILMTAFAFIFGMIPLWVATGSGASSRRILGTVVIGGMLAATFIAIFLIPTSFDVVERLAHRSKGISSS